MSLDSEAADHGRFPPFGAQRSRERVELRALLFGVRVGGRMTYRISVLSVVLVLVTVLIVPGIAFAAPDAPLLLEWTQRNVSGFGAKDNAAVSALEVFGGQLYAGTTNDLGAQLWRTSDGGNWSRLTLPGFSGFGNGVTFDMIVYNGQLYVGFGAWPVHGFAGQIWRTPDGITWQRVTGAWEANANNAGVNNLAIFRGVLYVTTYNPVQGIEVWRSGSGNPNDWARVANASFGLNSAYGIATGLAAFNDALYVALEGQNGGAGTRIYRSFDGVGWAPANAPGFGNSANYASGGFAVHKGYLYVGTRNDAAGGQIWRSANGANWTQVATSGFGDPLNYKVEGLVSAQGTLFAFTDNDTAGAGVWSSPDGSSWERSNTSGFGSANNKAVALWSNGAGVLSSQLFLGTFNQEVGGQVWSAALPGLPLLPNKTYLPLTVRG
jgi:hypothetical protein